MSFLPATDNLKITTAERLNTDISQLKRLWLRCFEDSTQAVNLFFDSLYRPENTFAAELNGSAAAMLFLIPCTVCGSGARYLYAACTDPEYRRRGIMERLLAKAAEQNIPILLLPADEKLYSYYARLGYRLSPSINRLALTHSDIEALTSGCIIEDEFLRPLSPSKMTALRRERLKGAAFADFDERVLKYAVESGSIYGGRTVFYKDSYALVSACAGGSRVINEIICTAQSFLPLLKAVFKLCPADEYLLRLPVCEEYSFIERYSKNIVQEKLGMIYTHNRQRPARNIYIGLTLD